MNPILKMQGGEQLARTLRGLDPSESRGVKVAMLKKAAEPIRQRMEELVVIGDIPPHIVDAIVVQAVTKVDDEDFGGTVDIGEHAAAVAIGPSKDAFYGHFIEYGTAPHDNHPGTPAKPFARPAFDEMKGEALKSLQDDIWARIRNSASRSTTGRGE